MWAVTIAPCISLVASLKGLMKSIMLTPYWPSVLPTGGAALAWPARIFIFKLARTALSAIVYAPCTVGGAIRRWCVTDIIIGFLASDCKSGNLRHVGFHIVGW